MLLELATKHRQRTYSVGLTRDLAGWERAYYGWRGWLHGDTFQKPQSRAMEWARCLASPNYAARTWLRMHPKDEHQALKRLKTLVIALFVFTAFVWGIAYGEDRVVHYLQNPQTAELRQ